MEETVRFFLNPARTEICVRVTRAACLLTNYKHIYVIPHTAYFASLKEHFHKEYVFTLHIFINFSSLTKYNSSIKGPTSQLRSNLFLLF
jgi:hypothetical protein